MTTHEDAQKNLQLLLSTISPEFTELTASLNDVMSHADNPMLVTALLYKLSQERHQTNALLEKMYAKYDELSFQWKTSGMSPTNLPTPNNNQYPIPAHSISLLPQNDQKIMKMVEEKGSVDASLIQTQLGYKNPNAASQRLNMLVKAGHLGKIQSGKKVVFVKTN
jgi:hypothetical protein